MNEYAAHLFQCDQLIFSSCGSIKRVYEINKQESVLCVAVASLQEVAESRIILYAVVAFENGAQLIVANQPGTAVLL